jgi:hypothetical protein
MTEGMYTRFQDRLTLPSDKIHLGEGGPVAIVDWRKHVIEESIGNKIWQYFPIIRKDGRVDVINRGRLGCYLYVSMINIMTALSETHPGTWVAQAEEQLSESGWFQVQGTPRSVTDIVIWGEQDGHQHIGFYMGDDMAISMHDDPDDPTGPRTPRRHHLTFEGTRAVEQIWTHPALHG